jgi:hypothetical protein
MFLSRLVDHFGREGTWGYLYTIGGSLLATSPVSRAQIKHTLLPNE